jgi:hypothetical protein
MEADYCTRMKKSVFFCMLFLSIWPHVVRSEHLAPPKTLSFRLQTIPPRAQDAITGSEFARQTAGLSDAARQRAAVKELQRGNIPEFLRNMKPVQLSTALPGGKTIRAIIWVLPDYLAIGSDDDFLRIPLSYASATTVANQFGCVLPTRKIVDAIYEQAAIHLRPQPLPPGPQMRSSAYCLNHQKKIEDQRAGYPLGELTSGHKKDVVLTNLLHRRSNRIAIYGWHWSNGNPIQPLSTVHGAAYADYSHGIRLVYQTVWIDGTPRSLLEVLQDPNLGSVLTYESMISNPIALMRK